MLRLHLTPGSFFSRKVRIVLAEKALAYEPRGRQIPGNGP